MGVLRWRLADDAAGAERAEPVARLGLGWLLPVEGPRALQARACLRQAAPRHGVAHGQVLGAAVLLVVAAGGLGQGAAGPGEAEAKELAHAAASVVRGALGGVVAGDGLWLGGHGAGPGGLGGRLRWVGPLLDGEGGLHGDAALPLLAKVARQADVALQRQGQGQKAGAGSGED